MRIFLILKSSGSTTENLIHQKLSLSLCRLAEALKIHVLPSTPTANINAPHWGHFVGHHRIAKITNKSRIDGIIDQEPTGKIAESVEIMLVDRIQR